MFLSERTTTTTTTTTTKKKKKSRTNQVRLSKANRHRATSDFLLLLPKLEAEDSRTREASSAPGRSVCVKPCIYTSVLDGALAARCVCVCVWRGAGGGGGEGGGRFFPG